MGTTRRRSGAAACCALALAILTGGPGGADENPTQVTIAQAATFPVPGGGEVRVAPGAYQVTAAGDDLALTPATGGIPVVIAAEAGREQEPVAEPVAVYTPGEGEASAARHLVLLLPDGSRREAVGAEGAVLERGATRLQLPAVARKTLTARKLASTGARTPLFFRPGATPAGTSPAKQPPTAKAPPKQTTALPDTVPGTLPDDKKKATDDPSEKPGCQAAAFAYLGCTTPIALAGGCVFDPNDQDPYHVCVFQQDPDGYHRCIEVSNMCGTCGCRTEEPPPGKTAGCTWRTSDVIDSHIDVSAQQSLMRMMSRGGADRRDASAMISAAKTGDIEGIYRPGLKVTVDRGQRMTPPRPYWELLQGQPSQCLREPSGEPPMIVYRDNMGSAQTDQALRSAWSQCGLPTPDPGCEYVVNLTKPYKECERMGSTFKECVDRSGASCPWPASCKGDLSCDGTDAEQKAYVECMHRHDSNLADRCYQEAEKADPQCAEKTGQVSATGGR